MNHVTFIIDGFNLYHSVREAAKILDTSTKWLNIKNLCYAYLGAISGVVGGRTNLKSIYYFSAFAKHIEARDPRVIIRHKNLIKCLEDTGINVEMGRFKPKEIKCPLPNYNCVRKFTKHEEKETDVAIAVKLLEVFFVNECDTAVLVTGDTDLAPATKTANKLFPDKHILFAFPAFRKNKELSQLAPGSFTLKPKQYAKYQFPDPYELSNGTLINKPQSW